MDWTRENVEGVGWGLAIFHGPLCILHNNFIEKDNWPYTIWGMFPLSHVVEIVGKFWEKDSYYS